MRFSPFHARVVVLIVLLFLVAIGAEEHYDAHAISGVTPNDWPPPQPLTPPFELNDLPTGGSFIPPKEPPARPSLPDLDVAFISRTPAYQWDASKQWPEPGEIVVFSGHIANRGSLPVDSFTYVWTIDGVAQPLQTHPGLASDTEDIVTTSWAWQTGVHSVRLTLDPSGLVTEISESNNAVEDRTNALSLGIYVEQSFYDFFNDNVWSAGWGGDSFDDWIQRHVTIWNQMFASARHPLTPNGVIDRVRLDKVVRVPDGDLHCSVNFPADDRTIDLIWGFVSEMVGVPSDPGCPGWTPRYRDDPSSWDRDLGLLHELSHARYLIDLYGMNIDSHERKLVTAVGPTDRTLVLSEIPDIPEFRPPANLILDGELIVCYGVSGNAFTNCDRGQEGTIARAHAAGATVFADQIHVQDGCGNALAGGPGLPATAGAFFRDRYFGEDLMNAGSDYGEHSAMAWNRIAGRRPVCGNANAPCNIGEYLNDIPADNIVELRWASGQLIKDARVEVFQAKPYPIWYGKTYLKTPDLIRYTNSKGRASLGAFPFGDQPPIVHTYSHSNSVLLLRIKAQGKVGVQFLEVTDFNLAYWAGHTAQAIYPITLTHYVAIPDTLGAPTLISPVNGSSTDDSTPTFDWSAVDGATQYRIQVDNDSDFSSPTIDTTTGSSDHTPGLPLVPGTYHWRVGASNGCADSPWSSSHNFTVLDTITSMAFLPIVVRDGELAPERWEEQDSGTTYFLKDVYFTDENRGWVVGQWGTILHTSDGGNTWSYQISGVSNELEGIHCTSSSQCWAVGDGGTILKTTDGGARWSNLNSGITTDLDNVQFVDANTGWIVGQHGTILKTSDGGTHWLSQPSGTAFWLWGLYFLDQDTGWVSGGGGSGIILHTIDGGASWTPTETVNEIADILFINPSQGWAVTNAACKILRTTDGGASWSIINPPETVGWLTGVHFISKYEGWVTGASGLILHTADGGESWNIQTSPASGTLQSVHFPSAIAGWIVGESGSILAYGK